MRYRLSIEPSRLSGVSKNGRNVFSTQFFAFVIENDRNERWYNCSLDARASIGQHRSLRLEETSRQERKSEREKRGQRRVYDVTQVTYEIIIDFRDLRASCVVLARRWLAFHITFATFAARTRLFSTLARSPFDATNHPLFAHPSFLSRFPYSFHISRLDNRASLYTALVIFCLPEPSCAVPIIIILRVST